MNKYLHRVLQFEPLESRHLLAGDITNLGQDASILDMEGDWLAYTVSEGRQGGADLNGDGDTSDQVLHLYDTATGEIVNVGLAISGGVELEGERAVFLVSESQQGGSDFNGDGDASDRVVHVYDTSTRQVTNLGLESFSTSSSVQVSGDLLAFYVSEGNQGHLDLNGDGDAFDTVLYLHDMASGVTTNLEIATNSFDLDGMRIAIIVSESQQGDSDLNGDGDRGDFVLHVYDANAGMLTNLALDVFGSPSGSNRGYDLVGDRLALRVSEGRQGNTDLNGDGDTDDHVLHLIDMTTMTASNLGLAVQDFILDDRRLAFEVVESAQGGSDLNGDGDAVDTVLHVYDETTATTRNLQLATNPNSGFQDLALGSEVLAVGVSEFWQANTDLNGDGDTSDIVPHIVNATGGVTNLQIASGPLTNFENRLAFTVRESSQGFTDLNGDGDGFDTVPAIYDVQAGETSLLPYAIGGFQLGRNHAVFTVRESNQGGTDLNGDGDATDEVLHAYNLVLGATTNFAIHVDDFEFVGERIAFLVSERRQTDTDLNGDGDTNDRVLHFVSLASSPPDPVALIEQLTSDVASLDLQFGLDNSLQVKLDSALKLLATNSQDQVAVSRKLEALIHEIEAQREKTISAADADELAAEVQHAIDLIQEPLLESS